jgi:hypothetical protein
MVVICPWSVVRGPLQSQNKVVNDQDTQPACNEQPTMRNAGVYAIFLAMENTPK